MFEFFPAHQNLGCWGVRVTNPFTGQQICYMDFRIEEYRPYLYVNTGYNRYTIGWNFVRKWK